jgi:hypothetical protein
MKELTDKQMEQVVDAVAVMSWRDQVGMAAAILSVVVTQDRIPREEKCQLIMVAVKKSFALIDEAVSR